MNSKKRILMIAAENDALPGAKIGGVGDVLRDLPPALVAEGLDVDVVIPSYGFLARLPGLESCGSFVVLFAGEEREVTLFKVPGLHGGSSQYILHHPAFAPSGESVYCNDPPSRPFATDATKYAFFCSAVTRALVTGFLPVPDILHCHDWHSAFLLIQIRFDPALHSLKSITTVFTIHNLAMQGVRPFFGDQSAFQAWYPALQYDSTEICDAKLTHCINPMRAAIRLADLVHTVSPTYAREILHASDHQRGHYGGEGLERDLLLRSEQGRLCGIINGCEYPKGARIAAPAKKKIVELAQSCLLKWASRSPVLASAHWLAEKRLQQWGVKKSRGFTLTSVGRITEQKARLLMTRINGKTALEQLLESLGDAGQFIMLGSGDASMEAFFVKVSGDYSNFIFCNGYSDDLSQMLYRYGDLFLMPSSFEPCGISQMLAMRAGQPCLVSCVGGLKDTVDHHKTGFCFGGADVREQAQNMISEFTTSLNMFQHDNEHFRKIAKCAAEARFTWQDSALSYIEQLYHGVEK